MNVINRFIRSIIESRSNAKGVESHGLGHRCLQGCQIRESAMRKHILSFPYSELIVNLRCANDLALRLVDLLLTFKENNYVFK